jgi:predicted pyridoxine 5'-phosphate oxidase superfamily flavin-nucleotide-binding protein
MRRNRSLNDGQCACSESAVHRSEPSTVSSGANLEGTSASRAQDAGGQRLWKLFRHPCIHYWMTGNAYAQLLFTEAIRAEQARAGSRAAYARQAQGKVTNDHLGPEEADFIAAQDHFFFATSGETGYPYVQHRGGKPGLLSVVDAHTVAFADVRGNRQYISVGNLRRNDRVSLLLIDQAARARLKLVGRGRVLKAGEEPELVARLSEGASGTVERVIVVHVEAVNWNCPHHIVPRYTAEEVEMAAEPLRARIRELEAQLASAKPTPTS